jgi:hypothetical protein
MNDECLDHRFGHGGIGDRPQRRGECPENWIFSALGSVTPWLCGNILPVTAETTIKATMNDER